MESGSKRIFIVAGEASGDEIGASLVREILRKEPSARIDCIGGEKMKVQGANLLFNLRDLAVMGLVEVAGSLFKILRILNATASFIRKNRPDTVVLVDYPDFNFKLIKKIKKTGVRIVYYVSPQVWAWRKGRIGFLKKHVDRMLVILPFEKEYFKKHGMDVDYVGHPIMDRIPEDFDDRVTKRVHTSLDKFEKKSSWNIALLPGSRKPEIDRMLPELLLCARKLKEKLGRIRFRVPVPKTLDVEDVKHYIQSQNADEFVELTEESSLDVFLTSDYGIVKSGTSTLEAALSQLPISVVYKVSPLTYFLFKYVVRYREPIGMMNLLCGKKVAREFFQEDFKADIISEHVSRVLESREKLSEITRDLATVRSSFSGGASKKAADIVLSVA